MVEPILDPAYWKRRLETAPDRNPHHAIMVVDDGTWKRIESRHRLILAEWIKPNDSILDAGCGYGRLLHLLPTTWRGDYLGVDLSPDFIAKAQAEHPDCDFTVGELVNIRNVVKAHYKDNVKQSLERPSFDWAICLSIKDMTITNTSEANWIAIRDRLKKVAKGVMVLEYDENKRETFA